MPGKFAFMQSLNASVRSRPLIEARSPSSMTTLPLPPSLVPRNWQALRAVGPVVGADDHVTRCRCPAGCRCVTTGIFLAASWSSVGAMAAVSCGAMTTPLTPWLTKVCTLAISLATSFCELVVLSVDAELLGELRDVVDVGVPEVGVRARDSPRRRSGPAPPELRSGTPSERRTASYTVERRRPGRRLVRS